MVFDALTSQENVLSENLSLEEIGQILDVTEIPSLLLSSQDKQVKAGNLAMVKLSGYTREELKTLRGETLFKDMSAFWNDETRRLIFSPHKSKEGTLITRRNREVSINIKARNVGSQAQFFLLSIRPLEKERRQEISKGKRHIEIGIQLTNALQQPNLKASLEKILEMGKGILNTDLAAIYKTYSTHPQLNKFVAVDKSQLFPATISTSEVITHFKESTLSPPYPLRISSLHKIALESKASFFISIPLRDGDELLGILIVLGPRGTASLEKKSALLWGRQLGAIIEYAIRHFTHIEKLNSQVNQQAIINLIENKVSQHIFEGLIYLNTDLTIHKINPAAELILGYTSEQIQKYPFDDVLIGSDRLAPALREALDGISTLKLDNLKLHRRDGSIFPAELKIIPVVDTKTGKPLQILLFVHDLSKEEKNRLQNQHLQRRALVGDMNAIFAHEIRNPINNITTGVQLLERILPKEYGDEKILNGLYEDCERLTHTVNTILNYSSSQNFLIKSVDLPHLLKEILERWRPRMKRIGIEYHLDISPKLPQILGDIHALQQVFTNLINNAVHAMVKTKGGILAVKIREIQKSHGNGAVKVDILDTGCGIPKSARDHIFEPFFTTKADGTGLGLAITKQIITRHKGSISVSHLPQGTVFHVTLPVQRNTP